MSRRIKWLGVALLLWVSGCADVWQFQDLQIGTGDDATGDAELDSTVPDATNPDVHVEEGVDHTSADADSGALDAAMHSSDSADGGDALSDSVMDAACPGVCPAGAICDKGACVCQDLPNICPTTCVDFANDPSHCGGCTVTCPSGASCRNGVCACPTSQPTACGGACVDTKTDHANCGGCGTACPANSACHSGTCTVCGTSPTDKLCSAICVDVSSDVNNCGNCGHHCASGATCMSGVCSCPAGDPTTCAAAGDGGACVDTTTDHNNCGGCGNACKLAHSTSGCSSSSCVILSCNSGYADCDKTASNGCEIHTSSDPNNCAACRTVCTLAHATAGCSSSTCVVAACATGYADCDGIGSNGCEVNTANDGNNCGACSTTGTSHACTGGKVCQSSTCSCATGMHDCSGTCVRDTSTSLSSCGTTCSACVAPTNGTATCSGTPPGCGGSCNSTSFPTLCGKACVDTTTDNGNCGACSTTGASHACTGGKVCQSSTCTCPAGTHDCAGSCVSDNSTSLTSCGTTCAACVPPTNGTVTCSGAPGCVSSCNSSSFPTLCGSACVDAMTDNNNCGGCGTAFACAAGFSCVAGVCTLAGGSDAAAE